MDEEQLRKVRKLRNQNVTRILNEHRLRMNDIKRRGHHLRLWLCPLIALCFGALSWYHFSRTHDTGMGVLYALGSLAFLAMLILGAIFDRPQ